MDKFKSPIFLIGHRGVGKTTLLKDYQEKTKNKLCFDLDTEIEKRHKVKIQDLFKNGKESEFRKLELLTLKSILKSSGFENLIVALGAGFQLNNFNFPKSSVILWLRRETDPFGRIFNNRPRLTLNSNPLEEWKAIFPERELLYKKYSTSQLMIPEYFDSNFNSLFEYLNFKAPQNGYVTLIPDENYDIASLGTINLELRTDLISKKDILKFLKQRNVCHLVAIRNRNSSFIKKIIKLKKITQHFLVDWDLSLGLPDLDDVKAIDIYSTHSKEPIQDILLIDYYLRYEVKTNKKVHFKISPLVDNHDDAIEQAHFYNSVFEPNSYSFLPRCNSEFNLSYFRQLNSYSQKIGFYRFGEGSSLDQPFWWQWPKSKPNGYYGIYGQNISHSYTPSFHFSFFKNKNLWPLRIDGFDNLLNYKKEIFDLGLKALAVTSPYKKKLYEVTDFSPTKSDSKDFKSANTAIMALPKSQVKPKISIQSFNTDHEGLKFFLAKNLIPNVPLLVWGGGALLEQIRNLYPDAHYFSAQKGTLRSGEKYKGSDQVQLLWASGEKGVWPEKLISKLKLKIVKLIDLDYRENSQAKLYSNINSIDYVSGIDFFIFQALAQQKIWETYDF